MVPPDVQRPRPGIVGSYRPHDDERATPRWPASARDADVVELRADGLTVEETAAWVRASPAPTLVAVRTPADGGAYEGGAEGRARRLRAALEAGAAWVDVERDGPLASWADGPDRERVWISSHLDTDDDERLDLECRSLLATRAAHAKLVFRARSTASLVPIRRRLTGGDGRLVHFAMGRAGATSRLLALAWGGAATFGALASGRPTAPGQWSVGDLRHVLAVDRLGPDTPLQFLIGNAAYGSPSPAMHRAAAGEARSSARYLPLEIDTLAELDPVLRALPETEGLAITIPFKEVAAARCVRLDPVAEFAGAVNTVRLGPDGWDGANTDGPAAVDLLGAHLDLRGATVSVRGAGGTAAAIAACLVEAGAAVVLTNRDATRARALAARVGASAGDPPRHPAVVVNATPVTEAAALGLDDATLRSTIVLDAVYAAPGGGVAGAARAAGGVAIDGLELLVAQAVAQFRLLNGKACRAETMRAAAMQWLSARSA